MTVLVADAAETIAPVYAKAGGGAGRGIGEGSGRSGRGFAIP